MLHGECDARHFWPLLRHRSPPSRSLSSLPPSSARLLDTMLRSAASTLRATRIAPCAPCVHALVASPLRPLSELTLAHPCSTLARSYRPSAALWSSTSGRDSPAQPVSDHRATEQQHPPASPSNGKGNTTSPTASASQYNAPKDPAKDKMEAEAAAAGPEAADAQYGPGNMVEGNYTKESQQAKDRAAAGKQGEN